MVCGQARGRHLPDDGSFAGALLPRTRSSFLIFRFVSPRFASEGRNTTLPVYYSTTTMRCKLLLTLLLKLYYNCIVNYLYLGAR
jgi:hypothetical protein